MNTQAKLVQTDSTLPSHRTSISGTQSQHTLNPRSYTVCPPRNEVRAIEEGVCWDIVAPVAVQGWNLHDLGRWQLRWLGRGGGRRGLTAVRRALHLVAVHAKLHLLAVEARGDGVQRGGIGAAGHERPRCASAQRGVAQHVDLLSAQQRDTAPR